MRKLDEVRNGMRDKTCPFEGCCNRFDKGVNGLCKADMEDVFDCFSDVENNEFRLQNLLNMNS